MVRMLHLTRRPDDGVAVSSAVAGLLRIPTKPIPSAKTTRHRPSVKGRESVPQRRWEKGSSPKKNHQLIHSRTTHHRSHEEHTVRFCLRPKHSIQWLYLRHCFIQQYDCLYNTLPQSSIDIPQIPTMPKSLLDAFNKTSVTLDDALNNFHLTDKLLSTTTNTSDIWTVPNPILTQVAEMSTILDNEIENFHLIAQIFEHTDFTPNTYEDDLGLFGCISNCSHSTSPIATTSTWMENNMNKSDLPSHGVLTNVTNTTHAPSLLSTSHSVEEDNNTNDETYLDIPMSYHAGNISFSTHTHIPDSPMGSSHGCNKSLTSENESAQTPQPHDLSLIHI